VADYLAVTSCGLFYRTGEAMSARMAITCDAPRCEVVIVTSSTEFVGARMDAGEADWTIERRSSHRWSYFCPHHGVPEETQT